jgi:spermidine synthase
MTTQEFFQIVSSHLAEDGVLTINSASVPGDRRLINGLATTMGTIFPSIYTVDIPGSLNTMIFATKQKTQPENFAANLIALSQDPTIHPLLIVTMQTTFAQMKSGYEVTTVFTDDHAPIEWIVNDMVVKFILGGGTQYLQ